MSHSIQSICETFSSGDFVKAYPYFAPGISWTIVGQSTLTGIDKVTEFCNSMAADMNGTTLTNTAITAAGGRIVIEGGGVCSDNDGQTSRISYCDVYTIADDLVQHITSYCISLRKEEPAAIQHTTIQEAITIFCVPASSFPAGVGQAHQRLRALAPVNDTRRYFGISRPDQSAGGTIMYMAGAEQLPGEQWSTAAGIIPYTVAPGTYIYIDVPDFMTRIPDIAQAFSQLTAQPGLQPDGYCIEQYLNDRDVRCMIKLA